MMILQTEKQWQKEGRILVSKRLARETGVSSKGYIYKLFAFEDTRPMTDDEQVAFWFYEKIVPMKKEWYYQKRTERKDFKKSVDYIKKNQELEDHCYPLPFSKVSSHFRGTGATLGLTFKRYSRWFRIDLDNHLQNKYGKLFREFSLIYQYLIDNNQVLLSQGIRWFVEFRPDDLSGVHFDFFFDEPTQLSDGQTLLNSILTKLKIIAEVYVSDKINCKLFGCVQYKMILNKIYNLPCLVELKDFLSETENYDHPSLEYVVDALNFSFYPIEEFTFEENTFDEVPPDYYHDTIEKIILKKSCWTKICSFFIGNKMHKIGELNKMVLIVSRIAFLSEKTEFEIVEAILRNLAQIDRERTVSSYYFLSELEKYKRITELVRQAVRFQNVNEENFEKLKATSKKFTETGRNVLDTETMRNGYYVGKGGPSIFKYNVGAFSLDQKKIPPEYREEIITRLSDLLPKKQKEKALDIAFYLANFCHRKCLQNKPVSRSLFNIILKNKFGWKPRTNKLQGEILDRLIGLGVIKRTELKYTMYWSLGDRFSQIFNIAPSTKSYFNYKKLTKKQLDDIHGTTID